MSSLSAVCVHDDLTSCQTGVAMRTADHEFSCRVHMKDVITLEERGCLRCKRFHQHRQKDVLHILTDFCLHCLVHALLAEL